MNTKDRNGRTTYILSDKVGPHRLLDFKEIVPLFVFGVKSRLLNRFRSDLNHDGTDAATWTDCNHIGHALLQKCIKNILAI